MGRERSGQREGIGVTEQGCAGRLWANRKGVHGGSKRQDGGGGGGWGPGCSRNHGCKGGT